MELPLIAFRLERRDELKESISGCCVEEIVSGTKQVEGLCRSQHSLAGACLAQVSSWRLVASCKFLLINNYCQSVHGAS